MTTDRDATLDAVRLRRHGLTLPILVYPNALPEAAPEVIAHGLTPALTDLADARALADATRERPCAASDGRGAAGDERGERGDAWAYPVFVKVDVGLERLGVAADHAVKLVTAIAELPRLRLEGLCTHLHVPAGADREYVAWQFSRFTAVLDALAANGIEVPVRLAASSPLERCEHHGRERGGTIAKARVAVTAARSALSDAPGSGSLPLSLHVADMAEMAEIQGCQWQR